MQLNSPDLAINTKPFQLINIDLSGQFGIHLNLAIIGGIIISIPYILWEFWRFVRPALYENERKHVTSAVVYSSFLFLLGVCFGYFLIVPLTTHFSAATRSARRCLIKLILPPTSVLSLQSFLAVPLFLNCPLSCIFWPKLVWQGPLF